MHRPIVFAAAAVVAHALATILHGLPHQRIPVPTTPEQNLFIATVIGIGPLVALALLATRLRPVGAALLLATMAGSLVFGVYHHFVALGPDHVSQVPPEGWGALFGASAVLLAVTEALGCLAGGWVLRTGRATRIHVPEARAA